MDSSADTKQADPREVGSGLSTQEIELVARADERLAHAYEQIARADEQLARLNEQVFKLDRDAARRSSDAKRTVKPPHRRIARQACATRLDRPAVDSGHLYRCFRLAVLWRDGQADDLPVGTATGFVVAVGNAESRRPAEPACCSGGCNGCCSTFAIITSGSDRAARSGSRPGPTRGDAVAPDDGA